MYTGPKLINDNLVFGYDTGYGVADNVTPTKFYKGAPTTNVIHGQNAVAQNSYTTWSATSSGNWNANHPKAIRAYNAGGGEITGYYNGGVGSAENTHHAHWQLDPILKKPVVVMNDRGDAQWKAKSYGTGLGTWTSQGKTYGDTYTISWLQWVDDLSKNARTGLYTQNTSGSNGFHDGQSTSASSYNTKLRTWQRVYQTYTTANSRNLNHSMASIYMYGHYSPRAVVKVADVQWQWGSTPFPFSETSERSDTESLIDLKNTTDIDVSNIGFDSTGQPEFDGSDDYVDLGSDVAISPINQGWTAEYVFNTDSASTLQHFNGCEEDVHNAGWIALYNSKLAVWNRDPGGWYYGDTVFTSNTWYHVAFVQESGTSMQFYVNGVAEGGSHTTYSWNADKSAFFARYIGRYEYGGYSRYWNGHIPVAKLYSQPLTAAEIQQNYKAYKSRFNI